MTPFRIKPSLVATPISEHVSFSDQGPLLEALELLVISHGSYQPLNLPYLSLSTQYSILILLSHVLTWSSSCCMDKTSCCFSLCVSSTRLR